MSVDKVRENRLRRMAQRQGYVVVKSSRRDPRAYDFGGYMIIDPDINGAVAGANPMQFSLDLDGVEEWLSKPAKPR